MVDTRAKWGSGRNRREEGHGHGDGDRDAQHEMEANNIVSHVDITRGGQRDPMRKVALSEFLFTLAAYCNRMDSQKINQFVTSSFFHPQ